jgi:hypothetical protein
LLPEGVFPPKTKKNAGANINIEDGRRSLGGVLTASSSMPQLSR